MFNITTIDNEPRVFDLDVADALGFERPRDIRPLIERNAIELSRYGILRRHTAKSGGRGRPAFEYHLNEGQALLIATFSRTEKAANVRETLIRAFMDWREGKSVVVRAHHRRPPGGCAGKDMADLRLRPDFDRIQAAYDHRIADLESADLAQLLRFMARTMARLDDIAPEPKTYSLWDGTVS